MGYWIVLGRHLVGGIWVGEGGRELGERGDMREVGQGHWAGCGDRQQGWPHGHENEWKPATDRHGEVRGLYRMRQSPGIKEAPKNQ